MKHKLFSLTAFSIYDCTNILLYEISLYLYGNTVNTHRQIEFNDIYFIGF